MSVTEGKQPPNPFRIAVTPETGTVGPSPERAGRMFTTENRLFQLRAQLFCGEFDGRRPKRVLVKIIGE